MGLLNKLKGVFFEEEEVEVEEDEKENEKESKDKVAVAKKIETPEKKEELVFNDDKEIDLESGNTEEFKREKDFFPSFDDKDFEVEKTMDLEAPMRALAEKEQEEEEEIFEEIKDEEPQVEEYHYEEVRYEEAPLPRREDRVAPYQGLYEGTTKNEPKASFTPSPIISPIYGILNKNYKKEEIVTKKEIRLSQTSAKKADLDIIREKAYGDLAGDISASIEEGEKAQDKDIEATAETKEDLLYDLNDESPTVKVVTVGDAEEYYNDLGLEYNVDYKVEKDEPTQEIAEDTEEANEVVDIEDKEEKKEENKIDIEESEDDKNIFDLIDSMYEDKE